MNAIAFLAEAEDGVIKIPKKYQNQVNGKFQVIILKQESLIESEDKPKKRVFDAISITTKDLKFDRDEANER